MRISENAWKIIEKFLKPSSLFAFMIYGAFVILCLNHADIPKTLDNAVIALLAFYFGQSMPRQKKEKPDERTTQ